MQIELLLEKECSLEPGAYMVKAEGKKLIIEKFETEAKSKTNPFWGLCADKKEILEDIVENAMKDRERLPLRIPNV